MNFDSIMKPSFDLPGEYWEIQYKAVYKVHATTNNNYVMKLILHDILCCSCKDSSGDFNFLTFPTFLYIVTTPTTTQCNTTTTQLLGWKQK